MAAIPPHDTAVVEEPWDGSAEEAELSNDEGADVYRGMYAWVDPDADPDTKAAYKFPHHRVDDGKPGPANLEGCRGGLGQISNADVPDADRQGIEDHLQAHIDANEPEDAGDGGDAEDAEDGDGAAAVEQGDDEAAEADEQRPEARGGWLAEVVGHAWAVRPEVLAGLLDLRQQRATAGQARWVHSAFFDDEDDFELSPGVQVRGQVAIVPLHGMITPRASLLSLLFGGGGGSLESFVRNITSAVDNSDVKAVVIDVDSPGGLVDGVPEAAATIRELRGSKPIVAVANTVMASAAYWLGSQADEVVVTSSGEVGSIGVYAAHEDVSALMERIGVRTTLVSAGKYKTEGNPFEPLSDEARAHLQEQVDDLYGMFIGDVAKGRDVRPAAVRSGFGQGRLELAGRAVEEGLADRVATLDQTVRTVLSGGRRPARQQRNNNGSSDVPAAEATAGADRGGQGAEAQAGAAPSEDERRRRELLVDTLG